MIIIIDRDKGEHVTVKAKTDRVNIWSGEHYAWWRANACGYCADRTHAGVYTLAEAIKVTHHVGPEKKIKIVDAPPMVVTATVVVTDEMAIRALNVYYGYPTPPHPVWGPLVGSMKEALIAALTPPPTNVSQVGEMSQ